MLYVCRNYVSICLLMKDDACNILEEDNSSAVYLDDSTPNLILEFFMYPSLVYSLSVTQRY